MEEKNLICNEEVNELVNKALVCLKEYDVFTQEQIDYIVAKASVAALDAHGDLAKIAIDETKRGVFEDKATKNLFACEYIVNNMRHQSFPPPISFSTIIPYLTTSLNAN